MKETAQTRLDALFDFISFTHEFREVVRVARAPHAARFENDAEHSYQLAMVAWYLIETDKLELDKELCLAYALAHDLVEVYAGDTYIFDSEKKNHESKKRREEEALKKIKDRFPAFKRLAEVIERYERKDDDESRFIYALDKLIPPVQIFLEDGKLWREKGITLNKILENKTNKIAISGPIYAYWKQLAKRLEEGEERLFGLE